METALDSVNVGINSCRNPRKPYTKEETSCVECGVCHLQFLCKSLTLNFRCKLLHQTSSPAGLSLDPSTPTKPNYSWSGSLATDGQLVTAADLSKVSCKKQLEQLAQLYSSCIAGKELGVAR